MLLGVWVVICSLMFVSMMGSYKLIQEKLDSINMRLISLIGHIEELEKAMWLNKGIRRGFDDG